MLSIAPEGYDHTHSRYCNIFASLEQAILDQWAVEGRSTWFFPPHLHCILYI